MTSACRHNFAYSTVRLPQGRHRPVLRPPPKRQVPCRQHVLGPSSLVFLAGIVVIRVPVLRVSLQPNCRPCLSYENQGQSRAATPLLKTHIPSRASRGAITIPLLSVTRARGPTVLFKPHQYAVIRKWSNILRVETVSTPSVILGEHLPSRNPHSIRSGVHIATKASAVRLLPHLGLLAHLSQLRASDLLLDPLGT